MSPAGRRVAIVASSWHPEVVDSLVEGALQALQGSAAAEVIRVPGGWEIGVAAGILVRRQPPPDAILALGCVIQGETAHARLLSESLSDTLMRLQADHGIPIAWGVLTPASLEHALERSGDSPMNRGREAAEAALAMLDLMPALRQAP